jgi:hypothetical protein
MYAVIRRYTAKKAPDEKAVDDFKRRIETNFVPQLNDVRGFHGYYVIRTGNNQLVSITICEDKAGATESTRRAADFVKTDPLKDQLGSPEVMEGDLLVSREAVAGAR